jgi:hypothetical protein
MKKLILLLVILLFSFILGQDAQVQQKFTLNYKEYSRKYESAKQKELPYSIFKGSETDLALLATIEQLRLQPQKEKILLEKLEYLESELPNAENKLAILLSIAQVLEFNYQRYDLARKYYQLMIDDYPDGYFYAPYLVKDYQIRRSVVFYSSYPEAMTGIGRIYSYLGQNDLAEDYWKRVASSGRNEARGYFVADGIEYNQEGYIETYGEIAKLEIERHGYGSSAGIEKFITTGDQTNDLYLIKTDFLADVQKSQISKSIKYYQKDFNYEYGQEMRKVFANQVKIDLKSRDGDYYRIAAKYFDGDNYAVSGYSNGTGQLIINIIEKNSGIPYLRFLIALSDQDRCWYIKKVDFLHSYF